MLGESLGRPTGDVWNINVLIWSHAGIIGLGMLVLELLLAWL